jgi:hypothetical protein
MQWPEWVQGVAALTLLSLALPVVGVGMSCWAAQRASLLATQDGGSRRILQLLLETVCVCVCVCSEEPREGDHEQAGPHLSLLEHCPDMMDISLGFQAGNLV